MSGALDPELLEALVPEFLAMADRLAAAADAAAARPALDGLRAMAEGMELASVGQMLDEAPLDPFTPPAGAALAAALAAQIRAIEAAGADVALASPAVPPPAAKRTLVVDDSSIMRRLLREVLSTDPAFEVVGEAADGEQGLAAMGTLRPDLILLDIEMPVLDGMGALRRWALEGTGAVVIVSSAARPAEETAIEARRLGASAIVGKPSGALSLDIAARGAALLRAARRATGLPAEGRP